MTFEADFIKLVITGVASAAFGIFATSFAMRATTSREVLIFIIKERVKYYPKFYLILSNTAKFYHNANSVDDFLTDSGRHHFAELLENYQSWDNNYGLFLSPTSGQRCYEARLVLVKLVKELSAPSSNVSNLKSLLEEFFRQLSMLEVALKNDIGVHGLAIALNEQKPAIFSDYDDLRDKFNIKSDKQ